MEQRRGKRFGFRGCGRVGGRGPRWRRGRPPRPAHLGHLGLLAALLDIDQAHLVYLLSIFALPQQVGRVAQTELLRQVEFDLRHRFSKSLRGVLRTPRSYAVTTVTVWVSCVMVWHSQLVPSQIIRNPPPARSDAVCSATESAAARLVMILPRSR